MSGVDEVKNKKKVPPVAKFDRGPRDFFRGSRNMMKKSFFGFRRGSK